MIENYFALSRFRIFPSDNKQSLFISIWNAETDTIRQLSCKDFNDFSLIKQLVKKLIW